MSTVLFQTIPFSICMVFVYTQLNVKIALSQTTQFSISKRLKCQTFLLDPLIEPYQMLPFRARMALRAVALKRYSTLPKASAF